MKKLILVPILLLASALPALAQTKFTMPPPAGVFLGGFQVVASCGGASGLAAGNLAFGAMDTTGVICTTGSGGTGAAVTIANGADVALGSTTDSPASVPTSATAATTIALLKALNNTAATAIPAGTAIIGKVGIDQTTDGTTNLVVAKQATAANLNATIVGTGTFAAQAQPTPVTSGGLTVYNVQPTASDNHANIKNGAGQVYKIDAFNNSATINYIRLYNAGTGFNGCNSATNLVWQGIIPASTSGAGLSSSWDLGIAFATGVSICVTSGYAQTDTTNATASALIVNVGYK